MYYVFDVLLLVSFYVCLLITLLLSISILVCVSFSLRLSLLYFFFYFRIYTILFSSGINHALINLIVKFLLSFRIHIYSATLKSFEKIVLHSIDTTFQHHYVSFPIQTSSNKMNAKVSNELSPLV